MISSTYCVLVTIHRSYLLVSVFLQFVYSLFLVLILGSHHPGMYPSYVLSEYLVKEPIFKRGPRKMSWCNSHYTFGLSLQAAWHILNINTVVTVTLLCDDNLPIKQPSGLGTKYIGTMLKCSPEEILPLVCDHLCLVLGNAKGGHTIGRPLCIKIQS